MILMTAFKPLCSDVCLNGGLLHSLLSGLGVDKKAGRWWPLTCYDLAQSMKSVMTKLSFFLIALWETPWFPFSFCLRHFNFSNLWLPALDLMTQQSVALCFGSDEPLSLSSSYVCPCASFWGLRNLESAHKSHVFSQRTHSCFIGKCVSTELSYHLDIYYFGIKVLQYQIKIRKFKYVTF